ncbi:MAG: alginate export family protein [Candidatus Omnitrophica bacterium]|nr:alginate export family protein [Candidatus Omnitrophota bacterium]
MRRSLIAFIVAVGLCSLAFSATNNIKVSGDITAQAITRDLSLGATGSIQDSEDFILSQVRVRFDADLTENVSAVVQLINERLWGKENNANTDIDLDLAYFTMNEMIYEPLTLIIGRQPLRYGRGLIIGDPDTDNNIPDDLGLSNEADDLSLRKSFDAVRAILDYSPLVIDLIYAKVDENTTNIEDDVTLYGINAAYQYDENTLLEGYFFAKDKDQAIAGDDNDKVYVIGVRGDLAVDEQLSLYGEYAYQFGDRRVSSTDHDHIDAFALQLGGEYKFNDPNSSKVGLCYTYLSGDDGDTISKYEGWNPMFEDQRVGEIANILFNNTNMWYIKASGSTKPREDITAGLDVYYLRLAEGLTSPYNALSNNVITNSSDIQQTSDKDLGWEIDASLLYDYTEDVQLGLVAGWFIPGDHFDSANNNTAYSVRATAKVEF